MPENIKITSQKPGGCACGHTDVSTPVLDVRTIPHQIRHATIHGAFDAIAPGDALVLIAPHAPVPLLRELEGRFPIDVEYLQEGPEEWHVKVTRGAAG